MNTENENNSWAHVMVRVGLNVVTHPIEYAKVLIQIGHEPLQPYKAKTIFGKEKLFYPSIFSYIAHIKRKDGFSGCYRGLTPKLASNICSGLAFQKVVENINIVDKDIENQQEEELSTEKKTLLFVQRTVKETVGRAVALVVSHPFHVITVRTMAEFVGQDGKYVGLFSSIGLIYREKGFFGFFAGLEPRLLYDIGVLWLSSSLIFAINNFVIEDKDIKSYISASLRFMCSAIMYPLQVVSNCMAASDSGLIACSPPNMPVYSNWVDCYRHLRQVQGLKRGSSIMWRAYSAPLINSSHSSSQSVFLDSRKFA